MRHEIHLTEAKIKEMINFGGECLKLWGEDGTLVDVSLAALAFFGVAAKEVLQKEYDGLSPEYQPDGKLSKPMMLEWVKVAFERGEADFDWLYKKTDGRYLDCHIHMRTAEYLGQKVACAFVSERFARTGGDGAETAGIHAAAGPARTDDRIHVMLDAVPIGCWLYSDKGVVIDCNQHAVDMLEMGSKGELNRSTIEACAPEFQKDGTPTMEYATNAFIKAATEGVYKGLYTLKTKSGKELVCEHTLVRVTYNGKMAIMSALRETDEDYMYTKQLKAEHRLRQRLQAMLESSPLCTFIMDASYKVVDCNRLAVSLFEFRDKQHFIDSIFEIAPKFSDDNMYSGGPMVLENIQKAIETGYAKFEWTARTLFGKEVPTEFTIVRVELDDNPYVIVYIRDLTDFYKSQEIIRERDAYALTKLYLDASPLLIEIFDDNHNLIDCNQSIMDFYGVTGKEDYFRKFPDLSPKYQPCGTLSSKKAAETFREVIQYGTARHEWLSIAPDGGELPLDISYVRLNRSGRDIVVGYAQDLRPIKEAERLRIKAAEESNLAKSRFLAIMSHEIRTPITAVLGISEIELQNPALPPRLEASFAKIHSSAGLLLGIVNDVLDLSKIEAGKMELQREEYDVASMIFDVIHLHPNFISNRDIAFRLFIDENIPARLFGDNQRIEQILNNILSNAFKYTEKGMVELIWQSEKSEKDGYANLIVTVNDTGRGMTKEQLELLQSNEYTRFHETEKGISGTGLGIPIVFDLIAMMEASIVIDSEAGIGTRVTVNIPQGLPAEAGSIGKETAERLQNFDDNMYSSIKKFDFTPEPMPYGKVLVVDDVDANLYVARGLLAFYDLKIETCTSGYEAIEKVKQGNTYDIIFMDQMMPGLTGTQAMHALRDEGYTRPIVALTANALIGQAEEFIKSGFDGFISKPIQTKRLNSLLTKYIRDKQPAEVIEAARLTIKPEAADINSYQTDAELMRKLRHDFARSQKNVFEKITRAIDSGDTYTARHLTHTLKGVAALIGETPLFAAAEHAEKLLASGQPLQPAHLHAIENELAGVLGHIGTPEPLYTLLDKASTQALFDNLQPLLQSLNAESLSFIDELRTLPETAVLVKQIETFDFRSALKTLQVLRDIFF